MPVIVDKVQHYKTIRKTCYAANTVYLLIHILYLILFLVAKFYILAYVDAGVIALYLAFFLVLRKKKYYLYALLCGNEFLIFVSVATVMLGFSTGFPFYLIGLCVVSFFTTYFSKVKNVKGSIIWVGLSLAVFLTLFFVTEFNPPYYVVDKWLEITLLVIHAVMVFGFVLSYMVVFLKYAFFLERKIMNESRTDELTQISNRYGLYDYFEEEKAMNSKALALFDIDNFKSVNDKYGHAAGDAVLRKVAEMANAILKEAFVCRYGGEEFVIVMESGGKIPCFERLETLRKAIAHETVTFEKTEISVTITIGVASYQKGYSLEKWVEAADAKMYEGKNSGKNKTVM